MMIRAWGASLFVAFRFAGRLFFAVAALSLLASETRAATYYVATNGSDAAAGTNWVTAKKTIQSAVNLAIVAGDTVIVSNGLYDTGGATIPSLSNNSSNRVAITNAITVQSVNGPDVTIIKGSKSILYTRCAYVGENARLTGFTLTGGGTLFNGFSYETDGGGAYCASGAVVSNCTLSVNSSLNWFGGGAYGGTLIDCRLLGNDAYKDGGGAYNSTLINCVLTTNKANRDGGGAYFGTLMGCTLTGNSASLYGGGVNQAAVSNCTFSGNTAGYYGGGAYQGTLYYSILSGNTANQGGGGAYQATLNNCKLTGNTTVGNGGGSQEGTLNNCEVSGNSAQSGGGVFYGNLNNCTVVSNTASSSAGGVSLGNALNCIIYFNNAPSDPNGSAIFYYNTCTTPLHAGPGMITNDPQFVNAAASNFHLSATSPCIDKGDNAYAPGSTDLDGKPRIVNTNVDMGAYEYQGANADSDGDGFRDADETIAGTNPSDSNSFFRVSALLPTASIQFGTVTGRLYSVDRNNALVPNPQTWTEFTNNIPGTGSPLVINDPLPGTNRNYRVRVRLP